MNKDEQKRVLVSLGIAILTTIIAGLIIYAIIVYPVVLLALGILGAVCVIWYGIYLYLDTRANRWEDW